MLLLEGSIAGSRATAFLAESTFESKSASSFSYMLERDYWN